MTQTDTANWTALHVFLSDPEQAEAFLLQVIAPACDGAVQTGKATQWFFIRYWEGGPHMRVRIQGLDETGAAELTADFRAKIEAYRAEDPIDRETYYARHTFDGGEIDVDALPWYGDGAVELIQYDAEVFRYGGWDALKESERLFAISSKLSVALLKGAADSIEKRMSLALVLMIEAVLAKTQNPTDFALFFRTYSGFWATYSEDTQRIAETTNETDPRHVALLSKRVTAAANGQVLDVMSKWRLAVDDFLRKLESIHAAGRLINPLSSVQTVTPEDREAAILNILGSHIHMTNNRLSVVPVQETLLSTKLIHAATALSEPPEMVEVT